MVCTLRSVASTAPAPSRRRPPPNSDARTCGFGTVGRLRACAREQATVSRMEEIARGVHTLRSCPWLCGALRIERRVRAIASVHDRPCARCPAAGSRHRERACCGFPRFDGRTRLCSAALEGEDGRLHDFYAAVLPLRARECVGRGWGRRWWRFWDRKRLDNHVHHLKRRPYRAHVLDRSHWRTINASERCMSAGVGRERSGIGVIRATENFSLIYGCVRWF